MNQPTSPLTAQLPSPGLRVGLAHPNSGKPVTIFLVKLPSAFLEKFLQHPFFSYRVGLFQLLDVMIPLFVLSLDTGKDTLALHTTIHAYDEDFSGMAALRALQHQPDYDFYLFDDQDTLLQVRQVSNTHTHLWTQIVTLMESQPPWTSQMFQHARAHIDQQWPTSDALWKRLQEPMLPRLNAD